MNQVVDIMDEYEESLEIKTSKLKNINYVEDFNSLEINLKTINEQINILNHQIEMNKQNMLCKIDENKNWIENPFHSFDSQKQKHILRSIMIQKIEGSIQQLKKESN